ncbi:MAG: hypothetical protein P4N60_07925 [Verrucomicrobiae bacterium]|nr:hypothetical protein [Verrucomicrobiae bacterium]
MTHLEYMQGEAAKNMAFHMEDMEKLQAATDTTLNFLYVFISAVFSASVRMYLEDGYAAIKISLPVLCIYLTALAIYLVLSCGLARSVEAPANEPKKLKIPDGYTSEQIQNFELDNLQVRIEKNRDRNARTANNLNFVRVMLCFSPIIFLLAILAVWFFRGLCSAGA